MITRIVKLPIEEASLEKFLKTYRSVENLIRENKGCIELKIFADVSRESTLFTVSRWEDESDLHRYRASELFQSTWPQVREMLCERAEAWTLREL